MSNVVEYPLISLSITEASGYKPASSFQHLPKHARRSTKPI